MERPKAEGELQYAERVAWHEIMIYETSGFASISLLPLQSYLNLLRPLCKTIILLRLSSFP